MTLKEKCILPLINDKLKIDDIQDKAEFIQLSLSDKNKPYIENCIFLMYKVNSTLQQYNIKNKLSTFENYYSNYTYIIDGVDYIIFVFTILPKYKQEINFIVQGLYTCIKLINKYKILSFNNTDYDIFYKLFDNNLEKQDIKEIPEKDYFASLIDLI